MEVSPLDMKESNCLVAMYAKQCTTAAPFNDNLGREDPSAVMKVQVPRPEESCSNILPTMALTFHHQKKAIIESAAAGHTDSFEVDSNLA